MAPAATTPAATVAAPAPAAAAPAAPAALTARGAAFLSAVKRGQNSLSSGFASGVANLRTLTTAAGANNSTLLEQLGKSRLVPVVSLDDVSHAVPVAKALLAGGLDVMELVLRTPQAEDSLKAIAESVPDMLVGAGTVLSVEQAERAVSAGARFLVAPGTNPKVVKWATGKGVLIVPGVATATEVEAALDLGLTHLKFFPAEANGGAKTLKALGAPYASVRWMPTGGLTEANMSSYLELKSVFAVGGSWLVPGKALEAGDYEAVEKLTRAAVSAASI